MTYDPHSMYPNQQGIPGLPSPEDAQAFRDAAEQKKIEVRAKLDQLEKEVLDAVYQEAVFTSSPIYKRAMSLADKNQEPSDEEVTGIFEEIKNSEGGTQGFAEFIMKSLEMPAKRQRAVSTYVEYRSMAEGLGLVD